MPKLPLPLAIASCVLSLGIQTNAQGQVIQRTSKLESEALILHAPNVQKELGLSKDQINKVHRVMDEQRFRLRKNAEVLPRDLREKHGETLQKLESSLAADIQYTVGMNDKQWKRFNQITLQKRGPLAFMDPDIQQELDLTDEQKANFAKIEDEYFKASMALLKAHVGEIEKLIEKTDPIDRAFIQKYRDQLTHAQLDQWVSMTGAPCEPFFPRRSR